MDSYQLRVVRHFVGQKGMELSVASLILSAESVFAVIFGAIFLKETMTTWEWIGCGLMFIAVILSQIQFKKKV